LCSERPLMNYPASDTVIYPGIIHLPEIVIQEIDSQFKKIYGDLYDPQMVFGRYSLTNMQPPNWAHSDGNMAQMLGLIYLFDAPVGNEFGTHLLRHIRTGAENHPRSADEMQTLLKDSNDRDKWESTFYCPAKFNRLLILNSDYIHAAGKIFGDQKQTGRLVISVFFNLKGAAFEKNT